MPYLDFSEGHNAYTFVQHSLRIFGDATMACAKSTTVNPVIKDHPVVPKIVVVVNNMWS